MRLRHGDEQDHGLDTIDFKVTGTGLKRIVPTSQSVQGCSCPAEMWATKRSPSHTSQATSKCLE